MASRAEERVALRVLSYVALPLLRAATPAAHAGGRDVGQLQAPRFVAARAEARASQPLAHLA